MYSLNVGNRERKFSKRTISFTNNVSKYYSFVTRFRFWLEYMVKQKQQYLFYVGHLTYNKRFPFYIY